jgi:large repetitive protein
MEINTLTPNAAVPVLFGATRAGQNGRYTFDGVVGQDLTVAWSENTLTTAGGSNTIAVYKPDGAQLSSVGFGGSAASGALDLGILPASGAYIVLAEPSLNTGQIKIALRETAAGAITIDGPSVTSSVAPGQNARYTFNGSAGQSLGLGLSALSTTPSGGYVGVRVLDPSGAELTNCSSYNTAWSCNLKTLPQAGTYAIVIDPMAGYSASVTLTLSSDVSATLVPNAAPTLLSTTRPGQNGRYTFSATAAQNFSLIWTDSTFSGYNNSLVVYKPDGAFLASAMFGVSGTLDLGALPATGTYTVLIDPDRVVTGQVNLALREVAVGSVAVDGPTLPITLTAGQNGRYTFSGAAGQFLGLGVSPMSTVPAGGTVSIRVLDPTGALLTDCGYYSTPWSCNLKQLPQAGNYVISVDANGINAASLSLTLSQDLAGPVTLNALTPTVFNTSRPGQNGRYTFQASAGQRVGIAWAEATIPGYWTQLALYRPDGSLVTSQNVGSAGPTGSVDLGYMSATGGYTAFIDPVQANTGQIKFYVATAQTLALQVDAAPVPASLPNAGSVEYTFDAAAGQSIGAILSDIATTPAAPSTDPLTMQLLSPTGVVLRTCTLGSTYNSSCRFPVFSAAGTYKAVIKSGPNAATFKVQLRSTI